MVGYEFGKEFDVQFFQKFIGQDYKGRKVSNEELVFHRDKYDFLLDAQKWKRIGVDSSITPCASFYEAEGCLFVGRDYELDLVTQRFPKKVSSLLRKELRRVQFEVPIGYEINLNGPDRLYHLYSGGVSLDKITPEIPKKVREEIENVLATALRELHENNVLYSDVIPSNFRYDFRGRIICNPHNCMRFKKPTDDEIKEELSVILLTHSYIEDKRGFLGMYYGGNIERSDLETHLAAIVGTLGVWIESGEIVGDLVYIKREWLDRCETDWVLEEERKITSPIHKLEPEQTRTK